MKYQIDHDLHIHSFLSTCCKTEEQTPERILQYAQQFGLKTICLTNHFWDETVEPIPSNWYAKQPLAHIQAAKPLPQAEGISFLFGCEVDLTADLTLGVSQERLDQFDFIVIPTTHMHFSFTTYPEETGSVEGRAKAWIRRLDGLLRMDLPFHKIGIAHLSCRLIYREDDQYVQVIEALPEDELIRLFTKAAQVGVGIELNQDDLKYAQAHPDILLRPFRIAKACGCKFYLASDAHKPEELDEACSYFQWGIDMLELTEEDKFIVK